MTSSGVLEMPTMSKAIKAEHLAAAPAVPTPAPPAPAIEIPAAPKADSATGINIAVGNMDFQLETTNKPAGAAAPAAPQAININVNVSAPPAAPAAAPAGGAIEISLSGETQAPPVAAAPQVAAPAPAIPAAPEIQAPPAPVLNIAPEPPAAAPAAVSEEEAARDLPYLFAGGAPAAPAAVVGTRNIPTPPPPVSSSHVEFNTGGPLSNDVETLKKYLTMREQDVSVLTAQLTYAKEELGKCEDTIKRVSLENEDLYHQINDLKKKVGEQEQELQHAGKSMEGEVEQLRFEVKSKIDRIKFLEDRLNDSAEQYEKLKERVRLDIRKIRVREKELESKLEILKKDSETLIAARENKILELKRKIDLLEFNYDTLLDKNELEKGNVVKANEKIERILKILRLAVGVIDADAAEQAGAKDAAGDGDKGGEKAA
jgi:predicted  nucleic acid-binding Zn-ribbon protein